MKMIILLFPKFSAFAAIGRKHVKFGNKLNYYLKTGLQDCCLMPRLVFPPDDKSSMVRIVTC